MRLKTLLSRSLLVAVGLCVGASAWADDTKTAGTVTTNADIDFSNAITEGAVKGTVNSMTLSNTSGSQPFELGYTSDGSTTSGDVLRVGNGTGTVTIPDDQLAGKRDEVVITFDMYFGKLSGKSAGFYLYDNSETPVTIGGFYHNWYNGTNTTNTFSLDVSKISAVGSRSASNASIVAASNKTTFEIHLNYATGTMYVVQSTNGTVKQTTSAVSMGSTNPLKTFVVKSDYNNSDRRCWFDNLVIKTTTGDYTVSSANYTVNWVLDGTTLKSETRSGDVGAAVSLLDNDKGSFFVDGVKYFYSSDDADGKTVAEDGSTVITITCRKAETWTYSVVSNTGTTLNTGSAYEGETVAYYWPEFVLDGTTLYKKNQNKSNPYFGATGTLDSNNKQFTVTYNSATINDVVFYKEAEDMDGFTAKTTNNATIRCSNGTGGISTTAVTLTTLPAGSYKIFGQVWGTKGMTATIKAGEKTVWEQASTGSLVSNTSDAFSLTESTELTVVTTDGNDNHMLDLVYIQKVADPVVTINTNSGLSSYSNAQTVTVTDKDVSIYVVNTKPTTGATTIELTKVTDTQVIPAGKGVLLYKAGGGAVTLAYGGTYDGTSYDSNVLTGTGSTAKTVGDSENIYALVNGEQVIAKVNADVEIPANKAYLALDAALAKLNIVFDGTTTGIGSVQTANGANDANAIYNLSGQRVSKSYKGVVVKGGKKYIQK